jgi:hypothetical protein
MRLNRLCIRVTDWHFDFQENWTLQLKGKKRWRLRASGVTHPLRGCTPHYQPYRDATPGDPTNEEQLKVRGLAPCISWIMDPDGPEWLGHDGVTHPSV